MDSPDSASSFQFLRPEHGSWAHRGPLILHEIGTLDVDIAALQEVNHLDAIGGEFAENYFVFFSPKLRPASAPGDGCALLVRRSRFEVLGVETLYYTSASEPSRLGNQNAILVTLLDTLAGRVLIVCCTHLKASQGAAAEAERLVQVEQLGAAARLARVRAEGAHPACGAIPTVICGDFNTYPGQKPYYSLLTLSPDLHSAYNSLPRADLSPNDYAEGEPSFTTFKFRGGSEKRETEDYIFYSAGKGLERSALLRLPSVEELGVGRGLPSAVYPSDHLCLGAEFEWLPSA